MDGFGRRPELKGVVTEGKEGVGVEGGCEGGAEENSAEEGGSENVAPSGESPPADSTPVFTASATRQSKDLSCYKGGRRVQGHTFGNVSVHRVDDDGDPRGSHGEAGVVSG